MRGPDLSEAVTTYPAAKAAVDHLLNNGFVVAMPHRLEVPGRLEEVRHLRELRGKELVETVRGAIIAAVEDCDEGGEF